MTTYRLLKSLTINRTAYAPGAVVDLNDRQAQWLATQGVVTVSGIVPDPPTPALLVPARRTNRCCGWR